MHVRPRMRHQFLRTVVLGLCFGLTASAYAFAGPERQKTYTVKEGDTLGEIVFMLRSQGVHLTAEQLHEWNPGLGTQVRAGQTIVYMAPESAARQLSEQDVEKAVVNALKRTVANAAHAPSVSDSRDAPHPTKKSYIVLVALFCAAAVVMALIFRRFSRKWEKTAGKEPLVSKVLAIEDAVKPSPVSPQEIPENPTQDRLKAEGIFPRRIILTLREGRVECMAELNEAGNVVVRFSGEPNPVRWDKRKAHAAKMNIAAKSLQSVS